MAFFVLPCPSRSPSSCWLAVNLISVWNLLSLWPSLSFHVLPGLPAPAGLLSTSSVSGTFSVYGHLCPSMSFQVSQLLLACCQPHQCLEPSQFMAIFVLPCPSRSPSSCWLAVNLISVWNLLSLW